MIRSAAELLEAIREKEVAVLDKHEIKHAPTIGRMYEGLTRTMMDRVIFASLDLRVVEGFIRAPSGKLSAQIDCMVVVGEGEEIPYDEGNSIYPISQVIAVIEVKKTLYSSDLASAYNNLRSVVESFDPSVVTGPEFRDAWRGIMRTELPTVEEAKDLPFEHQLIYHTLLIESVLPVRIALGYHGFTTEYSLRNAFLNFVEDNETVNPDEMKLGFGPHSFPNLILAGENALVKVNGMPFSAPLTNDGWWRVYGSMSGNSMGLLLELLWDRISYRFELGAGIFGEDLLREHFTVLVKAKAINRGELKGWQYGFLMVSQEDLEAALKVGPWQPAEIDEHQLVVIGVLSHQEAINVESDADFLRFLTARNLDRESFVQGLLDTGLFYLDRDKNLRYLTDECATAILSDGRIVAGENKSGRLMRWVAKYAEEHNARRQDSGSRAE